MHEEPVECLPQLAPVIGADLPQPRAPTVAQFDLDRIEGVLLAHVALLLEVT